MPTAAEKMSAAKEKIERRKDEAAKIGAHYKFVLEGDGGGTWMLNLKDEISVEEGDGDAECTVKMGATDFVDLLEGRATAQELFFAGKLQIEGDLGLAMRLQSLTEIIG